MARTSQPPARPFLRWVGGKARLVGKLVPLMAHDSSSTYIEPFAGAASLFFRSQPTRAVLGDSNGDLIDCYRRVASRSDLVWRYLRPLTKRVSESDYLEIREEFNTVAPSFRRAAMFIYLNKTSFNGIWRVSRSGRYNVPYGKKLKPSFPSSCDLQACGMSLQNVTLVHGDFEVSAGHAKAGDFVYFDPPYMPISDTAFFHHYTADRFPWGSHERLALLAKGLAESGVNVMVSEADSPQIRALYEGFQLNAFDVRRFVSSGSTKVVARELVITSYVAGSSTRE